MRLQKFYLINIFFCRQGSESLLQQLHFVLFLLHHRLHVKNKHRVSPNLQKQKKLKKKISKILFPNLSVSGGRLLVGRRPKRNIQRPHHVVNRSSQSVSCFFSLVNRKEKFVSSKQAKTLPSNHRNFPFHQKK